APSGNAAPMANPAPIFMSVDVFICIFLPGPALTGHGADLPLASPVPASAVYGDQLNINIFQR
ncbi:MAG: hypothetical protein WBL40_23095, partial [Terrimicrobiaceae bacterium]